MDGGLIETRDEEGGVRTLTLARPPANALDSALLAALFDAVRAAIDDARVRALIVRGQERFFSGGLDLLQMAGGEAGRMAGFGYGDGVFALWTCPKPTIAEISGHAIAGGALVALACDHRISARGTHKLGLNETAIGLAFPRGAFEIARATLPPHELGRILLGAELFEPEAALELGFVHELVDRDDLHARCLERARLLGEYPAGAYAYNKALVQEPYVARAVAEPESAREALMSIWTSEETVQAFLRRAASLGKKR